MMSQEATDDPSPLVRVVDDDQGVRDAVCELLASVGLDARGFSSVGSLLEDDDRARAGCLILDVRLPGLGGLELQRRKTELGVSLPIIFITAHGDIPMGVAAMKAGAVDFLPKPFRDQVLLEAVRTAIDADLSARVAVGLAEEACSLAARLTPREFEVMKLVAAGLRTREIATELGLSEVTIKMHRVNVMRKMGATTPVELAEIVRRLPKD